MNITAYARALGGETSGPNSVRCPGPNHSPRDRSLSVTFTGDDFVCHSFAGDDWQACRDHVKARLGLSGETSRRREVLPAERPRAAITPAYAALLADKIGAILKRSTPLKGTLAEKYLIGRGLDPDIASPEALRFLPQWKNFPASMVAVVTDFRDADRVLSLQFTPLKPDGTRGERTFLKGASTKGGVIRLVEDADVTYLLGVAEGVETALAVMTIQKKAGRIVRPTWSAMNANNLAGLHVLPAVEVLWIYGDHDENGVGQRAAETLARRWHEAGREVYISTPRAVGDWCDVGRRA